MEVCKLFFEVGIFSHFQTAVTFPEWHAADHLRLHYILPITSLRHTKKKINTALFSVQNDFPFSCNFIMQIEYHNLLHLSGNRYDVHRPYSKRCKLTTCAQVPLSHDDDNASDSSGGSASAAYAVLVSCYYKAQFLFLFSFYLAFFFPLFPSLAYFPLVKLLCSSVLHCTPVRELKNARRIRKDKRFLLISLLIKPALSPPAG